MSCLEELDHFESWMMFEVIGFMNEETHRSQIVTPYTKQYSREYSLNWLSYCAPVYLQISFNCKDILNFRLWSIMLDTGSALQFFHGRVHWPGSGVSSTLCGRCPEHLRTFDAGSILERENGVSQNNTHHNDNTKALIKILSSVLSTAATKQGGEHNQKQFRIRMIHSKSYLNIIWGHKFLDIQRITHTSEAAYYPDTVCVNH